jgi:hypothetical protein
LNNNAAAPATSTPPKFDFSPKQDILGKTATPSNTPLFGAQTITPATPATVVPAATQSQQSLAAPSLLFNKDANTPSFASLANTAKPTTTSGNLFGSVTDSAAPGFKPFAGFGGAGLSSPATVKPLFGSVSTATASAAAGEDGEEGGNENPEEYEPQVSWFNLQKLLF